MIVKRFDKKEDASMYAAELMTNEIIKKDDAILGLATGSTVEQMYNDIIKITSNKKIDWSKVKTFNLDEYIGLSEKMFNQSYRYYMNNNLFNHVNIDKNNTNFPTATVKPEAELKISEYDQAIEEAGGIDIQVLGIGNNGHIAFNEPGSSIESITRCVKLAQSTIEANSRFFDSIDEVPKFAVSMGLKTILKAKKIILLAFGDKKKEAITKLINAKTFDPNWPCTCLCNHPDVTIITDIK